MFIVIGFIVEVVKKIELSGEISNPLVENIEIQYKSTYFIKLKIFSL